MGMIGKIVIADAIATLSATGFGGQETDVEFEICGPDLATPDRSPEAMGTTPRFRGSRIRHHRQAGKTGTANHAEPGGPRRPRLRPPCSAWPCATTSRHHRRHFPAELRAITISSSSSPKKGRTRCDFCFRRAGPAHGPVNISSVEESISPVQITRLDKRACPSSPTRSTLPLGTAADKLVALTADRPAPGYSHRFGGV